MRRLLLAALISVLAVLAPVQARPQKAVIQTVPGGAMVREEGGAARATTSAGFSGAAVLELDDASPHAFVVSAPPYTDVHLKIYWSGKAEHWLVDACNVLSPGLALDRLELTRTVRFAVSPPPVAAWQVYDAVAEGREQKKIEGLTVLRMEETPDGGYVVRRAFQKSTVFLQSPSGEMLRLDFAEGQLSGDKGGDYVVGDLKWKGAATGWMLPVAGIAAVLAVLGLGVMLGRRRQRAEQPQLRPGETQVVHADDRPSFDDDELPDMIGEELATEAGDTFLVLRRIGRGGMGTVFEVEASGPRRREEALWAAKVLRAGAWNDPEYRERFKREVRFCSSLHHPNIVKILDWGLYARPNRPSVVWPFMVMERINGYELSRYVATGGTGVSTTRALRWMIQALGALHVAHARHIIHRDLKPANIMITESGHVKVMDFGLARQSGLDRLTRSDTAIGTPYYMSPEHLDARSVTPASDIYSMGVILFELLSGRVPFEGGDITQVLTRMLQGNGLQLAELRPDLPSELVEVVHRMFAPGVNERYASASEVIEALQPILDRLPSDSLDGRTKTR